MGKGMKKGKRRPVTREDVGKIKGFSHGGITFAELCSMARHASEDLVVVVQGFDQGGERVWLVTAGTQDAEGYPAKVGTLAHKTLETSRHPQKPRVFKSLDTVTGVLEEAGVRDFQVLPLPWVELVGTEDIQLGLGL